MELSTFFGQLASSPPLLITVLLTLGVILVNGWTDAPNAIAACIATRSMKPRSAIIMAAIMNFFGVLVMSKIGASVAFTIKDMVNFNSGADTEKHSLAALCAALTAIVVWAVAAWYFGVPTSESHALIAGLSGAAIALCGASGINTDEWKKVIFGLVLSTLLGFFVGWFAAKITVAVCRDTDRVKSQGFFKAAQIGGSAAMAFMHGAQDGQKFIGVFLLGMSLCGTQNDSGTIPLCLIILCSAVMGLGTSIGGNRIIKAVGMDMVKLERYQGFAADAAAAACLLLATLTGIPVSTTHTKTSSVMGVGAAKRISGVNWSIVGEMVLTWILTFPGCGIIGFLTAKLFLMML